MTWKYWTTARPLMVRQDIERKLKRMGAVRGKELARIAHNRIFHKTLTLAWDHWIMLMDDYRETYCSGPEYIRSKMQGILKIKREEERQAMLREGLALKVELKLATDKYRVDVLPDGTRLLPHFNIKVPGWFPVKSMVALLRAFRKIGNFFIRIRNAWIWFAGSPLLDNLVSCAVLANTILICCEHSRESIIGQLWGSGADGDLMHVRFQARMELGFIALICFYILESFFKLIGLGPRKYFINPTNQFDFMLMLVSAGQFSTSVAQWRCTSTAARIEDCDRGSSGLASLRVLRLIRIVRYIRQLSLVQEQLTIISAVMKSSYSLFLLLFVFVFMFASLGTQLFYSSLALSMDDPHLVGLGAQVWVDHFKGIKPSLTLPGFPGSVISIRANSTVRIWTVQMVTSFSEMATKVGEVVVCPNQDLCENHIKYVLPRSHFSCYTQSMVTVLQIMMRSGWIDIFHNCVTGSGYFYPTLFFGVIFFMWSYFLGNICSAVLIVGFSKKFDGEKKKLQALALKEHRIRALHTKFKQALISEYMRRIQEPATKEDESDDLRRSKRKTKKLLFGGGKMITNDQEGENALFHDPFDDSIGINPEFDLNAFRGAETRNLGAEQNYGMIERLIRDEHGSNIKSKRTARSAADDEIEIRRIQESLIRMSNFEREMYLRDGLNSLQVGKHLATTLGIASGLLQRRMDHLIVQRKNSPTPHHAAFYNQQIGPLSRRIKDVNDRIEALQHGHQTGMAFFMLRPYHPLRIFACNIVHRLWFERMMGTVVLASCVTLWIQRPQMASRDQNLLDSANTVFNFLFLTECILKVVTP